MAEKLSRTNSIEQNYNETEKTYVPRNPEILRQFLAQSAKTIEQPYLSHPSEPYSLRLRHTTSAKGEKIDATLKSRGEIVDDGLSRSEFTAPINRERYEYYTAEDLPTVRKTRSSPLESIDIDFYPDGYSHVESEDPAAWQRFLDEYALNQEDFIDVTGEIFTDNEWRAHHAYRQEHGGREAFAPHREFETDIAIDAILQYAKSSTQLSRGRLPVVRLYGRSGSGKSHLLDQLRAGLTEHGVSTAVLSTDDYNIGMSRLAQLHGGERPKNLDAADIYDLSGAQADMQHWLNGEPIRARGFDYETNEPVISSEIDAPANGVVFVEGLWARDQRFDMADLTFEIQTPVATAIGQRITRDLAARPEFADPEKNLGYYLEHAEPTYREA